MGRLEAKRVSKNKYTLKAGDLPGTHGISCVSKTKYTLIEGGLPGKLGHFTASIHIYLAGKLHSCILKKNSS